MQGIYENKEINNPKSLFLSQQYFNTNHEFQKEKKVHMYFYNQLNQPPTKITGIIFTAITSSLYKEEKGRQDTSETLSPTQVSKNFQRYQDISTNSNSNNKQILFSTAPQSRNSILSYHNNDLLTDKKLQLAQILNPNKDPDVLQQSNNNLSSNIKEKRTIFQSVLHQQDVSLNIPNENSQIKESFSKLSNAKNSSFTGDIESSHILIGKIDGVRTSRTQVRKIHRYRELSNIKKSLDTSHQFKKDTSFNDFSSSLIDDVLSNNQIFEITQEERASEQAISKKEKVEEMKTDGEQKRELAWLIDRDLKEQNAQILRQRMEKLRQEKLASDQIEEQRKQDLNLLHREKTNKHKEAKIEEEKTARYLMHNTNFLSKQISAFYVKRHKNEVLMQNQSKVAGQRKQNLKQEEMQMKNNIPFKPDSTIKQIIKEDFLQINNIQSAASKNSSKIETIQSQDISLNNFKPLNANKLPQIQGMVNNNNPIDNQNNRVSAISEYKNEFNQSSEIKSKRGGEFKKRLGNSAPRDRIVMHAVFPEELYPIAGGQSQFIFDVQKQTNSEFKNTKHSYLPQLK